ENGREAAKLYARWEHLDDKERERLLQLAEGGKDSPAFAEELMTNLSYRGREEQEAVLLLAGGLESGGRDGQVSGTDARLYKALSGTLATATGPDSAIGSAGRGTSASPDRLVRTGRQGNRLPGRRRGAEHAHHPDGRRRRRPGVRPEGRARLVRIRPEGQGQGRPPIRRGVPHRGRRHDQGVGDAHRRSVRGRLQELAGHSGGPD